MKKVQPKVGQSYNLGRGQQWTIVSPGELPELWRMQNGTQLNIEYGVERLGWICVGGPA